jgi:5-hydroxyisourate hydrolase-like protein (transthyretin family)
MKAKENIRLWFEFYKLSLQDDSLKLLIEKSKDYYADWGNVKNITFNKWWNDHKQLFDEVIIREIDHIDDDKSAIYLKVPLGLPITDLQKSFNKIITDKQSKLRTKYTKTKGVSVSKYALTAGTEFRADTNYNVLLVYRDVYLKNGSPPINTAFLQKVKTFFESRRAKKFKKLPISFASFDPSDENETIVRNCRRYIKKAQRLMHAAASGDFPGKSFD